MKEDKRIRDVLDLIDPPKGFTPWHGGPTLMGCLRGVETEQAAWRVTPERNSIWDLVLHMAYWKYVIIRKLNPDYPKGFERSPANFPEIPETPSEKDWKTDKMLLQKTHEKLIREIKKFPAEKLDEPCPTKKGWTYAQLITGIAAHDTYHIGQIQVLKRLYEEMIGE
ncbi:MAG: DinB family protein [Gracilimonas sp.]|uniref:DinB family protein n=1 Tax=Gracilimonas sp. TaxID=1974203 RepID=UPI00198C31E7|nr:DinB family protein [Gracilimonas sp.]MBD3617579.1 DinB family protein [Gracilimonas sp.]